MIYRQKNGKDKWIYNILISAGIKFRKKEVWVRYTGMYRPNSSTANNTEKVQITKCLTISLRLRYFRIYMFQQPTGHTTLPI
jgi:hypothetical protein